MQAFLSPEASFFLSIIDARTHQPLISFGFLLLNFSISDNANDRLSSIEAIITERVRFEFGIITLFSISFTGGRYG